mgnify:CR=1 FL=1
MKCRGSFRALPSLCRPRKGAWIEICQALPRMQSGASRPRKGAWIEISGTNPVVQVTASRPRKGAWIEIPRLLQAITGPWSPPQGGVD